MQNTFLDIAIPLGVGDVEVRANNGVFTEWLLDKIHLQPAETLLAVDSGAELDVLDIANPKVIGT